MERVKTDAISFRASKELREWLESKAAAEGISRATYVANIFKKLKKEEEKISLESCTQS